MAVERKIQQRSHRIRIQVSVIPCSDENETAHVIERYGDSTMPLDQLVFRNGQIVGETLVLIGNQASQLGASVLRELAMREQSNIQTIDRVVKP